MGGCYRAAAVIRICAAVKWGGRASRRRLRHFGAGLWRLARSIARSSSWTSNVYDNSLEDRPESRSGTLRTTVPVGPTLLAAPCRCFLAQLTGDSPGITRSFAA